jgi:UDP-glucose 4-epimerase
MKVLICGGAGYIGSHLTREILRTTSHSVVIVDNLKATKGHSKHLEPTAQLEVGDVRDEAFLSRVFATHKPDAVVHMCASIEVGESMKDPLKYYDNNVFGIVRILQAMVAHDCKHIVFSSTAALFGTPDKSPIMEDDKKAPESVYGETKLVAEWLLRACDSAHGIRSVCLRYFNACGAHEDGDIGEVHDPESHLIPIVLQVAQGKRPSIAIFGTDFPTRDGTCLRDYVHIVDLSTAHIKALDYLAAGGVSDQFNLGTGSGYTVKEVIDACRAVTGHPIPAVESGRRPGDPPSLVACGAKAKQALGWTVKYDTLEKIIQTAWNFHQKHASGYKE